MKDYHSNDEFFAALRALIDRLCDERRLAALARLLPAYLAFDGLTDGWNVASGEVGSDVAMNLQSDGDNFSRYEYIAPHYDFPDFPFEYMLYRGIRRSMLRGLSGRLLDAGVGTGRNFPFYPAGSHVVGIDVSPAMLARAERRTQCSAAASIKLTKMDVTKIDLPDRSFDAAVATFLFCVLAEESQVAALRELGRVVKTGGMIRVLNYVRPRGIVRDAIANLSQPCVTRAFGASFDRHTETAIPAAGLLFLESRYVVHDLIKLMVARGQK
jgi:ubiquinone/menaquinone biosynthesis C-methylase UbiE